MINDNYKEEIEYNSKQGGSDSRRHQRKLRNAAKTIMLLGSGNEDSTTDEDNRRWKTATWNKMNSNYNENTRTIEDTRRKTNTAANTINAFSITKRR